MLTARTSDNVVSIAWDVTREQGPFQCPSCRGDVIVKKGLLKVHHFAHGASDVGCQRGRGETEEHRRCKVSIYEHLKKREGLDVRNVQLEHHLGSNIADVYFERVDNNAKVAVEVQASTLDLQEIILRTERYRDLGVHVLWLAPQASALKKVAKEFDDESEKPIYRYSPRAYEKWLHAAYFGTLLFWGERAERVLVFKLLPYRIWRTERDGGAYTVRSRRWRELGPIGATDVLSLTPTVRAEWNDVPRCLLTVPSYHMQRSGKR